MGVIRSYASLHCNISWNNVEGLMNISHKLCVPALQRECLTFLLTHAAGKPIKAMRIAELFEEEELYRESSRFVLDNPGGWSEEELSTLSQETLLKLEKRCAPITLYLYDGDMYARRRNWFLERVLKLGLTPLAKEYQCVRRCLFSLARAPLSPHDPCACPLSDRTVSGVSRPVQLRPLARRKMATGVQRRLSIRCVTVWVSPSTPPHGPHRHVTQARVNPRWSTGTSGISRASVPRCRSRISRVRRRPRRLRRRVRQFVLGDAPC